MIILFNVCVLSKAYSVTTQTDFLGVMCLSRQVDPLSIAPVQAMDHVAYQIKEDHECSNMVVNVLPADPPP